MSYKTFPIVETAIKCGITPLNRTLSMRAAQANCPFCQDTKHHLFLYQDSNQYHCFHCCAHGNAVDFYAKVSNIEYKAAYHALASDKPLYTRKPVSFAIPAQQIAPLRHRHAVYQELLEHLSLSKKHYWNLRNRGLSDDAITQNGYRTMPYEQTTKAALARMLAAQFDLSEVPGFYQTSDGSPCLSAWSGLLIPIRNYAGLIQGLQIRMFHVHYNN